MFNVCNINIILTTKNIFTTELSDILHAAFKLDQKSMLFIKNIRFQVKEFTNLNDYFTKIVSTHKQDIYFSVRI